MRSVEVNLEIKNIEMTNDIASSSPLSSNYAPNPANYRSADFLNGNFPIQTPSGMAKFKTQLLILSLITSKSH